jgi:hypothetical protein
MSVLLKLAVICPQVAALAVCGFIAEKADKNSTNINIPNINNFLVFIYF